MMQLVGSTTEQLVYVASKDRRFNVNELLIVEDNKHGDIKGEVVGTASFNRYIPMAGERSGFVDKDTLDFMRQVGFSIEDESIHMAKVRILDMLTSPVEVGSSVRLPEFEEIRELLVKKNPSEGLTLGTIMGTEEVSEGMPAELKNIAYLYEKDRGILPQNGVPFIFDYKAMSEYPHIGIFGGSGSGKSFGLRVILEELMKKKIPTVVFDPHFEMEFDDPMQGIPDDFAEDFSDCYEIFTAGKDIGIDFTELTQEDLINILRASGGSISESMENAARTLYKNKDTFTTFRDRLIDLADALDIGKDRIFRNMKDDTEDHGKYAGYLGLLDAYGNAVPYSGTVKAILWRLNNVARENMFRFNIQPILKAINRRKTCIIRGSSLWVLTVFASYLIKNLYTRRRDYRDSEFSGEKAEKFPPFVVATDEAHNFAPRSSQSPSKDVMREIAQEGRKYGVFLILATQRPALLDDTVTAQLSTKIIFRTVRSVDIATIKEETDISPDEANRLPYMASGSAFISSAITGRTNAVRIRTAKTVSPHSINPFEELEKDYETEDNLLKKIVLSEIPVYLGNLRSVMERAKEETGISVTREDILKAAEELVAGGQAKKEKTPLGEMITEVRV